MPVSSFMRRASVRALAPMRSPHCSSVSSLPGDCSTAAQTLRRRRSNGSGNWRCCRSVPASRFSNSSALSRCTGPCRATGWFSARISSRISGATSSAQVSFHSQGVASGAMKAERIVTWPTMRTSCATPGGIHSARIGASSQAPSSVMTRMMPVGEYISWMRSCECASWRWPSS